jgi:hypothetical protein
MKQKYLLALIAPCFVTPAATDIFAIINTNDSGAGALRMTITDANGNAKIGTNTPEIIAFNIPSSGVHKIAPGSPLPTITEPVVIDGYTQTGASANTPGTAIVLDLTGGLT